MSARQNHCQPNMRKYWRAPTVQLSGEPTQRKPLASRQVQMQTLYVVKQYLFFCKCTFYPSTLAPGLLSPIHHSHAAITSQAHKPFKYLVDLRQEIKQNMKGM